MPAEMAGPPFATITAMTAAPMSTALTTRLSKRPMAVRKMLTEVPTVTAYNGKGPPRLPHRPESEDTGAQANDAGHEGREREDQVERVDTRERMEERCQEWVARTEGLGLEGLGSRPGERPEPLLGHESRSPDVVGGVAAGGQTHIGTSR